MSARDQMTSPDKRRDLAWKAISTLSAIVGGVATRKALQVAWSTTHLSDPPSNPADRRVSWGEAIQWAIATGVGVGVGRLVSERLAAAGWERATGSHPPGMRTD